MTGKKHTTTADLDSEDSEILRMPACVVQIYGGDLGRRIVFDENVLTIGRDDDSAIVIDLTTVSRHHARLEQKGGKCYVEDLGSTNGSFVNGERIHSVRLLRCGDLLKFGGAVFKFIDGGNIEALYHEEIYRMTIIDGLTEIANKRYLIDFLDREIARSRRHQRPLCVAMLDTDQFKTVNDELGHLAGDTVLRDVAQLLDANVRRDELAARFGGEEFVIVLPETEIDGAVAFCERVRRLVANHSFAHNEREIRVTVSIGVTVVEPDYDVEQFLAAADRRLYLAKQQGRDRLVFQDG